jgi:hypothetical protein
MALDKAGLTAALTSILEDLSSKTAAQKAAALADAIDAFVRTGTVSSTVIVDSVTLVQPGAGASGPGAGAATGTIS